MQVGRDKAGRSLYSRAASLPRLCPPSRPIVAGLPQFDNLSLPRYRAKDLIFCNRS